MKRATILLAGVLSLALSKGASAEESRISKEMFAKCFLRGSDYYKVPLVCDGTAAKTLYEEIVLLDNYNKEYQKEMRPRFPLIWETHTRSGNTYCYKQEIYYRDQPDTTTTYGCWFFIRKGPGPLPGVAPGF